MTELIKNEAEFIRNCATDIETGEPLEDDQLCNLYVIDAHRIADLIDAVEERNKELTLQLLAVHGQAADALDKLTKAVEALKSLHHAVCGKNGFAAAVRNHSGKAYPWEALDIADEQTRATLAEIKGESHE